MCCLHSLFLGFKRACRNHMVSARVGNLHQAHQRITVYTSAAEALTNQLGGTGEIATHANLAGCFCAWTLTNSSVRANADLAASNSLRNVIMDLGWSWKSSTSCAVRSAATSRSSRLSTFWLLFESCSHIEEAQEGFSTFNSSAIGHFTCAWTGQAQDGSCVTLTTGSPDSAKTRAEPRMRVGSLFFLDFTWSL